MKVVEKGRVCVTGAGGYIASWLVKLLLSNGYKVHGTVRNPGDPKNAHLKNFEEASQNLQLFNADLLDYTSLAAAIEGCEGVFHVASPVPITNVLDPQVEVINPALDGTLNVLKACSQAKVKRVIFVSTIGAVLLNQTWPTDKAHDEESWSDKEFCASIQNWYCLSKTLAEEAAWSYAKENGLDLVTVCPSFVIGPLLQPTMNATSIFLIGLIKGFSETLKDVVFNFVDVRDLTDALLLVYEKPVASGRYICAPHTCSFKEMVYMIKSMYPQYDCHDNFLEERVNILLSCEKLKALGWKYRTLEASVKDAVEYFQKAGLLDVKSHSISVPSFFVV